LSLHNLSEELGYIEEPNSGTPIMFPIPQDKSTKRAGTLQERSFAILWWATKEVISGRFDTRRSVSRDFRGLDWEREEALMAQLLLTYGMQTN
jgi:hypothetical protein